MSDYFTTLTGLNGRMADGVGNQSVTILKKMDGYVSRGVQLSAVSIMGDAISAGRGVSPVGGGSNHQLVMNRTYCEDRMACAICVGSRSEYQSWLGEYCKLLAGIGDKETLRMVCNDITRGRDEGIGGECHFLGLARKDVMKNVVLKFMADNRNLQTLSSEYVGVLEVMEE